MFPYEWFLVETTELFVERSKVTLFLHLLTRSCLALEQCEDNRVEFPTKFILLEHLFEESSNELGLEAEHTTAESAQNKGIVTIEQSYAINGTDLVEHHLLALRSEAAIRCTVFQIVGFVAWPEIKGSHRDDGGQERLFSQSKTSLTVIAEHGDIW